MTGIEIALGTLNMEPVDEPCILSCWVMKPEFFETVTGRDFFDDPTAVACETFRRIGVNLCPQLALPYARGKPSTGDWKAHYEASTGRYRGPEEVKDAIENLPEPEEIIRDFNHEKTRDDYAGHIQGMRERTGDDVLWISGFGQTDFMGGYTRWGYENYLECMALYPEHIRRYWDHSGESARLRNCAIVDAIRENDLAPFVYGGQDICFNDGPICSPAMLREYYFPSLKRAVEPLIENDVRIIWHCDGHILPILDDLIDLGVSGFQGFQEEMGTTLEDMVKVKTKWGQKPIFWGSVSVTSTLPFGTVEDVKRKVEHCFELAAPGGGFGLALTSSILPETPTENILALYEHGREYGRKFLRNEATV